MPTSNKDSKQAKITVKLIPPKASSYTDFPESTLTTEGIKTITADFSRYHCRTHIGIPYTHKSGLPLHLNIIQPNQNVNATEIKSFPLILYVQGSAWFKQNTTTELAQLSRFAQRGYVIAIVEYRPSPIAAFPAQIKDLKTAIRYMQANAKNYNADPEQSYLWGDSSGGHTVVMTAVTLNNSKLDDEANQTPLTLKAVIDYYGPTDISKMNEEPSTMNHTSPESPEGRLIGGLNVLENPKKANATNPMTYITNENPIPPILIMHGNKDRLVPFGQSIMLFNALKKAGKQSECYELKNADHGGAPFWTEEILDIVETFIAKYK